MKAGILDQIYNFEGNLKIQTVIDKLGTKKEKRKNSDILKNKE